MSSNSHHPPYLRGTTPAAQVQAPRNVQQHRRDVAGVRGPRRWRVYAASDLGQKRIEGKSIARNAITSPKVKNHSLKAQNFV